MPLGGLVVLCLCFYPVFRFVIGVAIRMALKGFETARSHNNNHQNKDNYFFHFFRPFDDSKVELPDLAGGA